MNAQAQQATLQVGSFLDALLEGERNLQPKISEYQFEREVLTILENPFGQEALAHYGVYVGELTKPLHVVSNTNRDEILFTVPALVQAPTPTMATGNQGLTADVFFYHLSRDIDLGGRHIDDKIQRFMMSITKTPNYVEAVILPIQQILARYGRSMIALPGIKTPSVASQLMSAVPTSSFSDEYDD